MIHKKFKPILLFCIVAMLLIPGNTAKQFKQKEVNTENISITLYDNAKRRFSIENNNYTITGTNALTALFVAADQKGYTYQISNEWYDDFSSFLVTKFKGIENQGINGWQYWVNYPDENVPMTGANDYELSSGDIVSWFYSDFDENKTTPDTSDHVINIEILIESDEKNPSLEITKPKQGGIYLNDNMVLTIPLISSSVIIKPITIKVEANDEQSGIATISFSIDNNTHYESFSAPYTWQYTPSQGINKGTLTITATDRSNNKQIIEQSIFTFG